MTYSLADNHPEFTRALPRLGEHELASAMISQTIMDCIRIGEHIEDDHLCEFYNYKREEIIDWMTQEHTYDFSIVCASLDLVPEFIERLCRQCLDGHIPSGLPRNLSRKFWNKKRHIKRHSHGG